MARFAFLTNGIASTFHAMLELSRRCADRGHEVVILGPVDVGDTVRSEGHGFVHLRAPQDAAAELRRSIRGLSVRRWRSGLRDLGRLPATVWRARRETVVGEELVARVREIDPDLVAIDAEFHVAILATTSLGVPTVLTTFWFALHERPGVPPLDTTLGPDDPAAIAAAWAATREASRRHRRHRWRSRQGARDLVAPVGYTTTSAVALRAVARHHGFDLRRRTDRDQWLRPWVYVDLPVLTTNLWELEFPHDPPPTWHYVGPMVHEHRPEPAVGMTERTAWDAYLADRATGSGRPLVYCSLGSYRTDDRDLLPRVVDMGRRHPEWDLVVGLGGHGDPDRFGALPDHVRVMTWAPQVEVLRHADVAIVHGGNAGLNECVAAGVPMVVYSTGRLDQNGISARIAHHGVGVRGDPRADGPDEMAGHVAAVLASTRYRDRVGELRDLAARPDRRAVAVDLLEAIAAGDR